MNVVVVGGGIIGCSVAARLALAQVKVTVLERSIPGAEASSAAAGILGAQSEADGPGAFYDLCERSRDLYPAFVDELEALVGFDVGYRPTGVLHVTTTQEGEAALQRAVTWQRARGLDAELVDAHAARALEPALASTLRAAAVFPRDASIDNRQLMRALIMTAAKRGVSFRTGYVRGLVSQGGRCTGVDLDGATLEADAVVVAAGSWTGLVQGLALPPQGVRPARGQMVMLRTRLPLLQRVVVTDGGYLVPRADGRLLAGSTMELVGFEKHVTAEGLRRILAMALGACPALAEAPVEEHWAGLRPLTEDRLPILGQGPLEGLFLASGHFRNGILLAPVTGELISQLVLGERTSLDLTPFRFDRPALKDTSCSPTRSASL